MGYSKSSVPDVHFKKAVKGVPGRDPHCDPELKNLKGTLVKVDSLSIHGRPLEGMLRFLDHNFLVIDVAYVLRGDTREKVVRYIIAEKDYFVLKEKSEGQIKLSHYTTCADKGKKHYIDLEGCGMIPGEKLLEILTTYIEPSYSLLRKNCWEYADKTLKKLTSEFANLPDTNSGSKKRLEEFLEDLPSLQLPSDAFKWVKRACCVVGSAGLLVVAFSSGIYFFGPEIVGLEFVGLEFVGPSAWVLIVAGVCALLHEAGFVVCALNFVHDFFKGMEPGFPSSRKNFTKKKRLVRKKKFASAEDLMHTAKGLFSIFLEGSHFVQSSSLRA